MEFDEFLSYFDKPKKVKNGYQTRCPAHDDKHPSLSISLSEDGKKILLHDHAGCSTEDILSRVGLKPSDLFTEERSCTRTSEQEYQYRNADGSICYKKKRFDKADGSKFFCFYMPDGAKGFKDGTLHVPYNLPTVCAASRIYFVEGEKCADAVINQGFCATTLDTGANSRWYPHYTAYFQGKEVIIIPDNDKPGMAYAKRIAQNIPNSKIIPLDAPRKKYDIYDWLKDGHKMEELDSIAPMEVDSKEAPLPDESSAVSEKSTQAEILLKLISDTDTKFFLDDTNTVYAHVPVQEHHQTVQLASKRFALWAQNLFYSKNGKPIKPDSLTQTVNALEAKTMFGKVERIPLYERVGSHDSDYWYDLSDEECRAVKVSASGWSIVNDPPILFRRYTHQKPQVLPKQGGRMEKIFEFINVRRHQLLFQCWLISCFATGFPHPMPVFYGEKGAAKSTACVLLKRLIDPSAYESLTLNTDFRSLLISLQSHWFLPFDNVSSLNSEQSDTLCRSITGTAVQQRKLYTDDEDRILTFCRCFALNGINNVARRSDLLDRSLLFELSRVPDTERKELQAVYSAFESERPLILGSIFDTLSKAMDLLPSVKLDTLPRMADFARLGYAVAEVLGKSGECFLDELDENYTSRNQEAIDADIVATLVVAFMQDKTDWSGFSSELYRELCSFAPNCGIDTHSHGFPKQANTLSRRLNSMKSNLASLGITFERDSKSRGSYISLHNEKTPPLPPFLPPSPVQLDTTPEESDSINNEEDSYVEF